MAKRGRPFKYSTENGQLDVDAIKARINEYFEINKDKPLSIPGLRVHLDITKDTFIRWSEGILSKPRSKTNEKPPKTDQQSHETSETPETPTLETQTQQTPTSDTPTLETPETPTLATPTPETLETQTPETPTVYTELSDAIKKALDRIEKYLIESNDKNMTLKHLAALNASFGYKQGETAQPVNVNINLGKLSEYGD